MQAIFGYGILVVIMGLRGLLVKCVTGKREVPGSSHTGSSRSKECPWARHFQIPSLVLVKLRKYVNMLTVDVIRLNVICMPKDQCSS